MYVLLILTISRTGIISRGGGELPYEEYMGVCHELGSHFQEKIPKRVYQFFVKIPERAIISVRNSSYFDDTNDKLKED